MDERVARTARRRRRSGRSARPRRAGRGHRPTARRRAGRPSRSRREARSRPPRRRRGPRGHRRGSASMRAPSTARSVTGRPISGRVGERHPAVVPGEGPVLEERADRLGHEQRVARGPVVDPSRIVGIERGPRDLRRELRRLGHREAAEVEPFDARPSTPTPAAARVASRPARRSAPAPPARRGPRPSRRSRVHPVQVVDDDHARTGGLDDPVDVATGDLEQRRGHGRLVGRHVRRLGLPARERGVAGDRGDRAAEAADHVGLEVRGEEHRPGEASRSPRRARRRRPARRRARSDTARPGRTTCSPSRSRRGRARGRRPRPRRGAGSCRCRPRRPRRTAPPRPVVAHRSRSARIRATSASRPTSGPVRRHPVRPGPAERRSGLEQVDADRLRLAAQDDRPPVGDAEPPARRRRAWPCRGGSRRAGRATGCAPRS